MCSQCYEYIYVPGLWNCPKCKFTLVQSTLNAQSGVITANDKPGEKCPNCNSPLWRVTERSERIKLQEEYEKLFTRLEDLQKKLGEICPKLGDTV